jgi:hypothetical protein
MSSPTVVRHYTRGNRTGVVIDVSGEFYFQVYDTTFAGTTHLIYTCVYSTFESNGDRMGALDHWLIFTERGNF